MMNMDGEMEDIHVGVCGDFLVSCGSEDVPMLVHIILNLLNNRMGRPPGCHLKDI